MRWEGVDAEGGEGVEEGGACTLHQWAIITSNKRWFAIKSNPCSDHSRRTHKPPPCVPYHARKHSPYVARRGRHHHQLWGQGEVLLVTQQATLHLHRWSCALAPFRVVGVHVL